MTAALALCSVALRAQNVHYGESFLLSDTLASNQSHEYHANGYIDLNPGFHSEPKITHYTQLEMDAYGIYPPEAGLTGGPHASDTGVVGALGGTIDVGLMGAAIYSIPLELPAGINGMQPNLSLTYNSQAGNGLLGWGWDIAGLSQIERTGRTRYHDGITGSVTMDDETDRFMLDGVRLIAVTNHTDSVEYKKEQDDMSKIMAYYEWLAAPGREHVGPFLTISHFKVWRNDGLLLEYGCTEDSRQTLQTTGPMALRWLLKRVSDRNGNTIIYHYEILSNTGECYISSIDYTEHTSDGIVTVNPEFTISFNYRNDTRHDYDFQYIAGNIIQNKKLLDYLIVNSNSSNKELERYSFQYRIDTIERSYGTVNMHNRLIEVGFEKNGVSINPTKIQWTSYGDNNVLLSKRIEDTAIYNNFPFVGDFNGDGYSDLAVVPHMDSVYFHNVDVNFFMNSPSNPGYFTHNNALTLHNIDKRLDWIYPVDLNDDGLDELVACFYDSIPATGNESMSVVIFENMGGSCFENRDTIHLSTGRYILRTGDFLGNGKSQLLLVPVQSLLSIAFPKLVYHDGDIFQKATSTMPLLLVRDVEVGDFNGDDRTEVLVVMDNSSSICSLELTGTFLEYHTLFNTNEINHASRWNSVFPGDFNGDGKTDLLYNDIIQKQNNSNRWRVFYSTGTSFSSTGSVYIDCNLSGYNLYSNSLRKVFDVMNQPSNWTGVLYGVCVADFDGDKVDDIAVSKMTCATSDIKIYCHYLPSFNKFQSYFFSSEYNGTHWTMPDYFYINCRSQYFHLGNFLGNENRSFLGLEYRDSHGHTVSSRPSVFSLKPASELNSVCLVNNGIDNSMSFEYSYIHNTYQKLDYGTRRLPVPIKVLATITTRNVTNNPVIDRIDYYDPCHHRDGHGWLGFKKLTRKTFVNGAETQRNVSLHSLDPMTTHAMLLPEADTVYVFPEGEAVLASVTSYRFEKALSTYGALNMNHLIVCPSLTGKTIVTHDPDNPGTVLEKTFTKNHYSYQNGLYTLTYNCVATLTGVGDASASNYESCEFRSLDSTVYYNNDYASWTINRPHRQYHVSSRTGKADVGNSRWFEYTSTDSYLPSRIFDIPGITTNQDPLTIMTDFEYHPEGNLMKKTVTASHGQFGEQTKTIEYEYGPEGRQRLVTRETVGSGNLSYVTSYAYDEYDRIDTVTAPNGLATAFDSDPFGITSWTINADGSQSCTATRWSAGHPLAPCEALYYTWTRSSDGSQSLVFHHKTGAELRTVNYGLHGEPIFTDRQYDTRGRLAAVSDPYKEGETPRWTTYGYDNLDRPTSVTTPDTTCTATIYDGFRTETTVTSPQGLTQESAVTVNAMGWTVRSDDASGSYVTYDHYADGFLASATVNGNPATTVTVTYDAARRRNTVTDPDYGTLTTLHDAYGRLKTSTSPREAAAQTQTSFVYDGLDRIVSMTDGLDGTIAQYNYNETGLSKGTLGELRFRILNGDEIQHITYTYDTLARPVQVSEQRATATHTTTVTYDSQSRVRRLTHPSGVIVNYSYRHGYLGDITDGDGNLLWRTNDMDARGQLLEAMLGNGAVTHYTYDTLMHRLKSIVTSKNLQNLTYDYDKFGNLASRKDNKTNMQETFTYDETNRLTGITLKRPSGDDLHCAVTYDAMGRMASRQAVAAVNGTPQVTTVFSQPVFDNTKVHALVSATTTAELFPSDTQSIIYTGFDKVSKVKQGNDSLCYTYGYDHQRILMEERVGSLTRTKQYWGNCEYVTESDGNTTSSRWRTFIAGPFGVFAVVETRNGMDQIHYVLKDNLGSWTTITDENGNVEQQLGFDAWGNLRNPQTWANYTDDDTFDGPMFDRGFTGHEHLTAFGLVNMNGRMYDPVTSSFLSADRFVQNPLTAMGFNRYAYCMNNPLRFVDPTGWEAGPGGGNNNTTQSQNVNVEIGSKLLIPANIYTLQ